MPGDGAITVEWRRSSGLWRATIPADEAAERGVGWVEYADLPALLRQAHHIGQAEGLRVEVWDGWGAHWVCGWPEPDWAMGYCGLSTAEGPCPGHYPHPEGGDPSGVDGLFAVSAETGRHPLGRRGMPWLGVAVFAVLAIAFVLAVGWWLR